MKRKRSVTISVYNKTGQILTVTNRRFGGFTLPGGKVEPGELPDEAAFRELYEETMLRPFGLKYLGCSLFNNPLTEDNEPYLCSHFEASFIEEPQPVYCEDGTVPLWRNPRDLCEHRESIFEEYNKYLWHMGVIKNEISFLESYRNYD